MNDPLRVVGQQVEVDDLSPEAILAATMAAQADAIEAQIRRQPQPGKRTEPILNRRQLDRQ